MPTVQEARSQENGVFSQGAQGESSGQETWTCTAQLPVPQLLARLSQQTHAAPGGAPSSLNCHPHPNRLGLRVRKLGTLNPYSTFKGSTSFTHQWEPPCHLPYAQGSLLPTVPPHTLQHFLIHSICPLCTQVLGTWNPLRHCLHPQEARLADGHRI